MQGIVSSVVVGSHSPAPVDSAPTVLIVGSCGLDRLLMVASYPSSDAKIRTTSYHEVGGGNAANTAFAMGRLATSLSSQGVRVKLGTKIGGDAVGRKIMHELQEAGVDLSSSLFRVGDKDTSTGFTTIIVSARERSRTCIHTPGTCGEILLADLDALDMNTVFRNVVHFHSDARQTEVALALAREARKRRIPVSLDVEKDRGSKALDSLLEEANIIFTNSDQIDDYLSRLTSEQEMMQKRISLPIPTIRDSQQVAQESFVASCARAIRPSAYFTRWFRQKDKEIVITKGEHGSLHVQCESINVSDPSASDGESGFALNQIRLSEIDSSTTTVKVCHDFTDHDASGGCEYFSANYTIRLVGIMKDCNVHDTTGAGDAFIGGFLTARLQGYSSEACMKFGAWVSGRKIEGPGARTTLPDSDLVRATLGSNSTEIIKALDSLIGAFDY